MPNQSSGKSPFDIVYIESPLYTLDLVPLPKLPRMSIIIDHIIEKIINTHEEIKKKLEEFVTKYKLGIDKHRRFKSFAERDQVMIHL